jgi:2-polyprenyl-3-methyl-5-hydroxy-6-metoxy-1,4-benzoquinol methylase
MSGPGCSCCYDVEFDDRIAEREIRDYRRRGPRAGTRALADALLAGEATGLTALDVGGGIGALQHLLLQAGVAALTDVDASGPYLAAARREAARRGLEARITFVHGDVVAVADSLGPADLVGLDRVACCYDDAAALVGAAARLTRRRLGIIVPPDGRPARLAVAAINLWQRILRARLRMHAHPHAVIRLAAEEAGLRWAGTRPVGLWRLLVFERDPAQLGG